MMLEFGKGEYCLLDLKVHPGLFPRAVALLFFAILETIISTQRDFCILLHS